LRLVGFSLGAVHRPEGRMPSEWSQAYKIISSAPYNNSSICCVTRRCGDTSVELSLIALSSLLKVKRNKVEVKK